MAAGEVCSGLTKGTTADAGTRTERGGVHRGQNQRDINGDGLEDWWEEVVEDILFFHTASSHSISYSALRAPSTEPARVVGLEPTPGRAGRDGSERPS